MDDGRKKTKQKGREYNYEQDLMINENQVKKRLNEINLDSIQERWGKMVSTKLNEMKIEGNQSKQEKSFADLALDFSHVRENLQNVYIHQKHK